MNTTLTGGNTEKILRRFKRWIAVLWITIAICVGLLGLSLFTDYSFHGPWAMLIIAGIAANGVGISQLKRRLKWWEEAAEREKRRKRSTQRGGQQR